MMPFVLFVFWGYILNYMPSVSGRAKHRKEANTARRPQGDQNTARRFSNHFKLCKMLRILVKIDPHALYDLCLLNFDIILLYYDFKLSFYWNIFQAYRCAHNTCSAKNDINLKYPTIYCQQNNTIVWYILL